MKARERRWSPGAQRRFHWRQRERWGNLRVVHVVQLGVDFGTSQTRAVCWSEDGQIASSVVSVPSLALVDDTGFVVGASVERASDTSGVVVTGLKRMLERDPSDLVARVVASRFAGTLHMPEDRLVLCTAGSNCVFVDGCIAALLHQASAAAAAHSPDEERRAVLVVPEWFDAAQRSALGEAARRAGLRVLRFIGDGAAAALWMARTDGRERTVAYVDVGAGGLSVTIVAIDPQGVCVSATAGDRYWGGDEVTAALVDVVVSETGAPRDDPAVRSRIRQAVETGKSTLAATGEWSAAVTLGTDGTESEPLVVPVEVKPGMVREALAGLLEAVEQCCTDALEDADIDQGELDAIFALGPTARLPAVSECIERALGGAPVRDEKLDVAAVLGAAYECAILAGESTGPLVLDGHSTGRLAVPSLGS